MEDGEIESKVSVSVITSVCMCVQVTMEDSIVTITNGSPAKIVKVCHQCYFTLYCVLQDPECHCSKSTVPPSAGDSSDASDNSKVRSVCLWCL